MDAVLSGAAGGAAAAFALIVVYPIETIRTRMQRTPYVASIDFQSATKTCSDASLAGFGSGSSPRSSAGLCSSPRRRFAEGNMTPQRENRELVPAASLFVLGPSAAVRLIGRRWSRRCRRFKSPLGCQHAAAVPRGPRLDTKVPPK